MRQFTAVVNPAAGKAAGAAALIPVARLLRDAGAQVEVEYSRGLDHARELARRAGERGRVVLAVGGDGTTGCVGGALAGTEAVCGLVPAGRADGFARALGLPSTPEDLAGLLLHGEPKPVDALEVSAASPAGAAASGAGRRTAFLGGVCAGAAAHRRAALRTMGSWRPAGFRLTVDGETYERRGHTAVVANSAYAGPWRHVAPGARVDDGVLDVIVVGRTLNSHAQAERDAVLRGREVTVEASREMPCRADGEACGTLPVTVRVLPGALNVLR